MALPTAVGRPSKSLGVIVDVVFTIFCLTMIIAMAVSDGYETVPYHLVYVAFAAVYGYRIWSLTTTVVVLLALGLGTGGVLVSHYLQGTLPGDELAEVVLMPMILVAMVWHARRRYAAQRRVEELVEVERARREREQEFLRDASHALRTPLTVARGHVELAREEADDVDEGGDLEIVLGELDRLDRLAARLLVIAGLERPDGLASERVDLAALVRRVGERWTGAADRNWRLDVHGDAVVVGESARLEEALDAMVENSVKVTEPGDPIRLVCLTTGGEVTVGVADSGPGILAGDADLVFLRFWRRRRHEDRPGSGLGLALVKAVADAHAGHVFATSSVEGGAFIGMTLPIVTTTPHAAPDRLRESALPAV
jgi:signal transduction histidine kinase